MGWRHGCASGGVVGSACSCPTSLQKHSGTISGPKAKNAPFSRNWLHQFYLKSQSLLHKQNPKSSGNVCFLVVSFYSFSSKIHIYYRGGNHIWTKTKQNLGTANKQMLKLAVWIMIHWIQLLAISWFYSLKKREEFWFGLSLFLRHLCSFVLLFNIR